MNEPRTAPERGLRRLTTGNRRFLAAAACFWALAAGFLVLHPGFAFGRLTLHRMLELNGIWSHAPAGARHLWERMVMDPRPRIVVYAVLVLGMAALQWAARRAARGATLPVAPIVAVSFALASLVFMTCLPVGSTDIFSYLTIAELADDLGLNPYEAHPDDHRELPSLHYGPAVKHGSIYGPFATRLFSLLYVPGLGVQGFLLLWRAFVALVAGLTLWLSWDTWKALGRAPPERRALLVAVAWSPVVLFDVALNGHVDVLASLLFALGLREVARGRETVGLSVLASAIAVKATFVVLWPVVLARAFFTGRTTSRGLVRMLVVVVAATAFYAAWLLPDRLSWSHLTPLFELKNWTRHTFSSVLRDTARPFGVLGPVLLALKLVFAFVLLRGLRVVAEREAFFRRLTRDYMLYLLVFGPFFYSWYLLPAFVLAGTSEPERPRSIILLLAATSLVVIPGLQMSYYHAPSQPTVIYLLTLFPATILYFLPERRRVGSDSAERGRA